MSRLAPVIWNTTALKNLVLDDREKKLITAILSAKLKQSEVFDDFVEGKGQMAARSASFSC